MSIVSYNGFTPVLDDTCFVAEGAVIAGQVKIGALSSVWFNAVIRGDSDRIEIGQRVSVQDCSVIHADHGFPTTVGDDVTIGHGAVVHGATVGSQSTIGMGAVLLNGAVLGEQCLVGAGAVVSQQTIAPRSLVLGVPAKVVRQLSDEELSKVRGGADTYVLLSRAYKEEADASNRQSCCCTSAQRESVECDCSRAVVSQEDRSLG